jgi:hypothetical protein
MVGAGISRISFLSALAVAGAFPFAVGAQPRAPARVGPYDWALRTPMAGTPVPNHPIFEGVPAGLMGATYANVAPLQSFTADVRPTEDLGPAVQVYSHGDGRIILTSLNLLPNLRTDALAEKLLANLVRHSDRLMPSELSAPRPETLESIAASEREYEDVLKKFLGNRP